MLIWVEFFFPSPLSHLPGEWGCLGLGGLSEAVPHLQVKTKGEIGKKKKKHSRAIRVISPGLEPGTTSVLDWCDNQLHHETKLVNRLLSAF